MNTGYLFPSPSEGIFYSTNFLLNCVGHFCPTRTIPPHDLFLPPLFKSLGCHDPLHGLFPDLVGMNISHGKNSRFLIKLPFVDVDDSFLCGSPPPPFSLHVYPGAALCCFSSVIPSRFSDRTFQIRFPDTGRRLHLMGFLAIFLPLWRFGTNPGGLICVTHSFYLDSVCRTRRIFRKRACCPFPFPP